MITPLLPHINKISITGQVTGLTYNEDHKKLVFTMRNPDGCFIVEFQALKTKVDITRGDQVIVTGTLYSIRSGRYDAVKIRAQMIKNLGSQE
jgi:exonuclease VII large subunit